MLTLDQESTRLQQILRLVGCWKVEEDKGIERNTRREKKRKEKVKEKGKLN